jgi:hypothetical protein
VAAEFEQGITRRRFVLGSGAVVSAVVLDHSTLAQAARRVRRLRAHTASGIKSLLNYSPLAGSDQTLLLVRREDMVHVQLDLFNVVISGGAKLQLKNGSKPGFLVYSFGPQHMAEEAVFEYGSSADTNATSSNYKQGTTHAILAGPSRIAYEVTASRLPGLTLADLLQFNELPTLSIPPLAQSASVDGSSAVLFNQPAATETAIEMPWHLVIAPDSGAFTTPASFRLSSGRAELWTARLTASAGQLTGGGSFRAPWNYDLEPGLFGAGVNQTLNGVQPGAPVPGTDDSADVQFPYVQPLSMYDRWNIVQATNNPLLPSPSGTPDARSSVLVDELWLSARGGTLDSTGAWSIEEHQAASALRNWDHLATGGRDHHVKVVDNGYLFPFGHRATVTIVTDREFQRGPSGDTVARSAQYAYITVLEPTVDYSLDTLRDFPFTNLTILTPRTPMVQPYPVPLAPKATQSVQFPPNATPPPTSTSDGWVPLVNGTPFLFNMVGTDWAGRKISFAASAMFVLQPPAVDTTKAKSYVEAYNLLDPSDGAIGQASRTANIGGVKVAMATPIDPSSPGDTDVSLQTLVFAAQPYVGGPGRPSLPTGRPDVLPTLRALNNPWQFDPQIIVRLDVAEKLSGGSLGTPTFVYPPYFVSGGFGGSTNVSDVFLKNAATPSQLTFANGSSGGLMTPNISIDGLSRALGPIADADTMAAGTFDPTSWFSSITSAPGASFLGGISLADILGTIDVGSAGIPGLAGGAGAGTHPVPQITMDPIDPSEPMKITYQLNWTPTIPAGNGWLTNAGDANADVTATFNGTVTTDLASKGATTYTVTGEIDDFYITIFGDGGAGFIELTFTTVTLNAQTGQKPSVTPQLSNVQFVGALSFVNQLEELISFTGDGSGLHVYVDGAGIHADLSLTIPPVGLGLFTISGISFGAALDLPLDGVSPAVFTFNFASQADPFTIAGGIFGGGGYFVIAIGTKDVQMIQVSFDFGAVVSLDLGLASGQASLTAGITYSYQTSPTEMCQLQAWVDFSGSLSILGIITLSLTFDLTLTWQGDGGGSNALSGSATLVLSISVFGFSKSVHLTAQKTFTNSGGDDAQLVRAQLVSAGQTGTQAPSYASQITPGLTGTWANNYVVAFG